PLSGIAIGAERRRRTANRIGRGGDGDHLAEGRARERAAGVRVGRPARGVTGVVQANLAGRATGRAPVRLTRGQRFLTGDAAVVDAGAPAPVGARAHGPAARDACAIDANDVPGSAVARDGARLLVDADARGVIAEEPAGAI